MKAAFVAAFAIYGTVSRSLVLMDQLYAACDKLFTEVDHLDRVLGDGEDLSEQQVAIALSVAKRVRRDSTVVVRLLASLRDKLQP